MAEMPPTYVIFKYMARVLLTSNILQYILQVREMMKATDAIGRSLIALATIRGRKGTLEAVLTAAMEMLGPTEVCHISISPKYVTLTLPS